MSDLRPFKVLYIEDDEANRQLVRLILARKEGLAVTCRPDGRSGIQAARDQSPDLILLDISLPDMDGYAVLAALREDRHTSAIPVVAMSGDLPTDNRGSASCSFDTFLTKPIEIQTLYQTIDRYRQA